MPIIIKTQREKDIVDNIIKIIKDFVNPERIYLFGSRTKGNATYNSDFDLGIEASAPEIERPEQLRQKNWFQDFIQLILFL